MHWAWLAIAIISEVIGTSALKPSAGFTRLLPSLVVIVGYGSSFYCLSLALERIPVGIAYAVWSGVGVVLVAGVAWWWHGDRLDAAALAGIGLIVAGVLVLNLLSQSVAGHGS